MISRLLPLALFALGAAAWACESQGYTPDCPPMPITSAGVDDPALVAWRQEAVEKGCATAAGSDEAGEAGAGGGGSSN
ncbi:MAG TPA: hypothetical protein VLC09_21985 [Polyangiaceae bacterium]|nr:hypothetical protein [Polyangiaceae bacterium]